MKQPWKNDNDKLKKFQRISVFLQLYKKKLCIGTWWPLISYNKYFWRNDQQISIYMKRHIPALPTCQLQNSE